MRDFAASGRPLLCVCLGMQILLEGSEEGGLAGLGLISGSVKRLPEGMTGPGGEPLKIPHMGWNSVRFGSDDGSRHPLFRGIEDGSHFYFVHSYSCDPSDRSVVAARADYGVEICAAVAWGEIVGVQFHPEKSGETGLRIYENLVSQVFPSARAVG